MANDPDEQVEVLAARADLARARMFDALSALDRRRHEMLDVELPSKVRAALLIVGTVAAAALAGALLVRVVTAGRRRRRARWMAFNRFVPRLPAPPEPKRSVLRKLAGTGVAWVAHAALVRLLDRLDGAAPPSAAEEMGDAFSEKTGVR